MAFTKTTWVDGSSPAITATQLNRIETGIDDAHAGNIDAGAIDTTELADNSVTNAKLRNSAALSVIGRASNSTGDPADISAGTDGYVLRRSGTSLAFGQVATAGIANDAVTPTKTSFLENVASTGKIYFGVVNNDTDTATLLPSGWSFSGSSAGSFTITHNLGTTDYLVILSSATYKGYAGLGAVNANSFTVDTYWPDVDGPGTVQTADGEYHFMLVLY